MRPSNPRNTNEFLKTPVQQISHVSIERTDTPTLDHMILRLLVARWTRFGALIETRIGDPCEAVEVNLGDDSLLDPLFRHQKRRPRVRVGDYPPGQTEAYHDTGRHIYVVNRRVLEADVIVSMPKLKTHQKVGITCALKGTVGTIARKECLAHHRMGGPEQGGDDRPLRGTPIHLLASNFADQSPAPVLALAQRFARRQQGVVAARCEPVLVPLWGVRGMGTTPPGE